MGRHALATWLLSLTAVGVPADEAPPPPAAFVLESQLVPVGPASYYGLDVDIDGDTAVVGAYYTSVSGVGGAGAAHVFRRVGSTWAHEQMLFDASSPGINDWFGWNVAISGDTIAVGEMKDDTSLGVDTGSVRVFRRSGTPWPEEAMLAPPSVAGAFFG